MIRAVLPLVLTEIGGRARRILLTGKDLPSEFPTIGGGVRGKTTWYAGGNRATSQVLGPMENGITFAGSFEDRKSGIPGHAIAMMTLVNEMRRAARPVRFEYGPISRLCRWGRATEFKIEELQRIAYRIELDVVDDEVGDSLRVKVLRRLPGLERALELAERFRVLTDILPTASGPIARVHGLAASVLSRLGAAQVAIDALGGVQTATNSTFALNALGHVDAAQSDVNAARAGLGSLSWQATSGDDFMRVATNAFSIAEASRALSDLNTETVRVRPELARVTGDVGQHEQIYVTRAGETLQRIALRTYGNAATWSEIARRNGIANPSLEPGVVLVLPNVPTLDKATA